MIGLVFLHLFLISIYSIINIFGLVLIHGILFYTLGYNLIVL